MTSVTAWLLSGGNKEDDQNPFAGLEEDEDELSENKIVMEDY